MLFSPTAMGITGYTGLPSAIHFSISPATCQGHAAKAVAAFAVIHRRRPQAPGIICASQFAHLQKILNTAYSAAIILFVLLRRLRRSRLFITASGLAFAVPIEHHLTVLNRESFLDFHPQFFADVTANLDVPNGRLAYAN